MCVCVRAFKRASVCKNEERAGIIYEERYHSVDVCKVEYKRPEKGSCELELPKNIVLCQKDFSISHLLMYVCGIEIQVSQTL